MFRCIMSAPYKHKSGAQKKKEREVRNTKSAKGQQTLDQLGFKSTDRVIETPACSRDEVEPEIIECSSAAEINEPGIQTKPQSESGNDPKPQLPKLAGSNFITSKKDVLNFGNKTFSDNRNSAEKLHNLDIGTIDTVTLTQAEVQDAVRRGPEAPPVLFPEDNSGNRFPTSVLHKNLPNGEKTTHFLTKKEKEIGCFGVERKIHCIVGHADFSVNKLKI